MDWIATSTNRPNPFSTVEFAVADSASLRLGYFAQGHFHDVVMQAEYPLDKVACWRYPGGVSEDAATRLQ
jgi:hypothetical protein